MFRLIRAKTNGSLKVQFGVEVRFVMCVLNLYKTNPSLIEGCSSSTSIETFIYVRTESFEVF